MTFIFFFLSFKNRKLNEIANAESNENGNKYNEGQDKSGRNEK